MFRAALVLILVMCAMRLANAQVLVVAADLEDDCRHKWPEPQYFNCAGYLVGVVQALQSGLIVRRDVGGKATAVKSASGSGHLCIASQSTPDILVKALVRYVELHPEKRKESPITVAAEALIALDEAPPRDEVAPATWQVCGRKP